MRSLTIKTRISVALLVAFILVAGIATTFAKASFRDTEVRHVREDSEARLQNIGRIVDTRLLALGQDAKAASNDAGIERSSRVLESMHRAGFSVAIVVGPGNEVIERTNELRVNQTLLDLLLTGVPASDYPATVYSYKEGWFLVGSRSTDLKHAVVGAMSSTYLSEGFFVDALVHPEYAYSVHAKDGALVAASANYPTDLDAITVIEAHEETLLENFQDADVHYRQRQTLSILEGGYIEGMVPSTIVSARVDEMTTRFVLSMATAFGIGGSITILLVAYSFRPLDRITEAARKLGRGEEELHLHLEGKDELGTLATVLNQSASALADARRAEAARATEARMAAEDFELAVGELSRSVGEADTADEVGARLAEGLLRVTTARAVLVRLHDALLACAARDAESGDARAYDALYASAPDAWNAWRVRSGEGELAILLLPYEGSRLADAEPRKVEILGAQAAVAIHRATASEALRQAKAQKETFLDILSHDLKNPLAVAKGRVELLARKNPDLHEKLGQIDSSLDRATRIIEEAVLLSKLEQGATLEREPLDLHALVEESAASLRPLAAPRGIGIEVHAPDGLTFPAHRLLQRAIENLISNAVKWSPENGTVEIDVSHHADACRIQIIDHGPGIAKEDKPRLFARFERADKIGVKGTGLGLAIAKRVTQMHGGIVGLDDTPGGGCTFVIELPHPSATAAVLTQEGRA